MAKNYAQIQKKIASPACRGMGPVIVEGERARPHLDALLALADVVVLSVPPGWGGDIFIKALHIFHCVVIIHVFTFKETRQVFSQNAPKWSQNLPLPPALAGRRPGHSLLSIPSYQSLCILPEPRPQ